MRGFAYTDPTIITTREDPAGRVANGTTANFDAFMARDIRAVHIKVVTAAAGGAATASVTVNNPGEAPAEIGPVTVGGVAAGAMVSLTPATPVPLKSGGHITVSVTDAAFVGRVIVENTVSPEAKAS